MPGVVEFLYDPELYLVVLVIWMPLANIDDRSINNSGHYLIEGKTAGGDNAGHGMLKLDVEAVVCRGNRLFSVPPFHEPEDGI